MKLKEFIKGFLLLKLLLVCNTICFSQSDYESSNLIELQNIDNTKNVAAQSKYTDFGLTFGTRNIKGESGSVFLSYIDESPDPDFHYATTELLEEYNRLGGSIYLNFGKKNKFNHGFIFDFGFDDVITSYSLGYSISKNIPIKLNERELLVRLGSSFFIGTTSIRMGDMQNQTVYIQVNDTKFFDDEISVTITSRNIIARPHLELSYPITDQLYLVGNWGYDFGKTISTPWIGFRGITYDEDNNEDWVRAQEKLNAPNVLATLDENQFKKIPVNLNGLRFGIGVSYRLKGLN